MDISIVNKSFWLFKLYDFDIKSNLIISANQILFIYKMEY